MVEGLTATAPYQGLGAAAGSYLYTCELAVADSPAKLKIRGDGRAASSEVAQAMPTASPKRSHRDRPRPADSLSRTRRRIRLRRIRTQTQETLVTLAERPHPFPSRTRKLSSPAPKILRGQPFGKIGRRQGFCVNSPSRRSAPSHGRRRFALTSLRSPARSLRRPFASRTLRASLCSPICCLRNQCWQWRQ